MIGTDVLLMLAGPVLRAYLQEPSIINILVNPNGSCFLERAGQPKEEGQSIAPDDLDRFLAAIADGVQQEWRTSSPSLHAALPAVGWRIQAAMPPQAPAITMALRKHPSKTQVYTLEQYVAQGVLTEAQDVVLREQLATRARIVIGGATGSAKTSLVNALLHVLGETDERICILQDDPELIASGRDVVYFQTHPGKTMTDLVVDALRYQPQRIIVGEVRDGAAKAMCDAFDTGHSGISTVHADSAAQMMDRLEELVAMSTGAREGRLLSRVIDVVVHMQRTARSWACTGILGVEGYANGAYILQPLA